ncbi:Nitrogen regulatory protein [uncultured delta proteobacterium]|uniref:Nitrogen regulatory protein n=1 Tax=uncultured delta proteobacterium TaxID=34034 RepID=A0A212J6Y5_9DELT|nr:Nitrogen regulatory protein [uncultured delta proteobacterium]
MRLSEYLCPACIVAELKATDKEQVLLELAAAAAGAHLDKNAVHAVLLERERHGTTAVGNGYAIPHGKLPGLDRMVLTFARSVAGVDFAAPDTVPCRFFFTVIAPAGAAGQHLGLLGSIARLAKDATFTNRLTQAKTAEDLLDFLAGA